MLAILLALTQPMVCHVVKSDGIYGRDLAAAVPALSAIAPDVQIALSPLPGQQRVFRIADLKRIVLTNHLPAETEIPEDVCFAWTLAVPDRKRMQSAMAKSLVNRNPSIQIVESSLLPAPEGEMVFPLAGLSMGSDKASVWRGYIRYAETRKLQIWARVLVTVKEFHVVAAADLHPGDTLQKEHIKLGSYQGPVRREKYLIDPAQAEGLLLRRPVTAGAALTEDMLEAPQDVNRGDLVSAIVQTGAARIEVQGVAESEGRKGQVISVRNPRSGRSFHARIEDKGIVVVVPGGQFGLAVEAKKIMMRAVCVLLCFLQVTLLEAEKPKKQAPPQESALDQYVAAAERRAASTPSESPGSLWSPPAVLGDMASDFRARYVDDILTITVSEQASAVATGQTKSSRAANANAAVTSAAGPLSAAGRFANLLTLNSNQALTGNGTTSRTSILTATLGARVVAVLPNGYLVIEGSKTTLVNSENQVITVRGVVRPADVSNANTVQSGNIAQLELKINGRGVVNDAIHRPNILYRVLLGLLPF